MTEAEQKAKELVDRFLDIDFIDDWNQEYWIEYRNAKKCALICVDEKRFFITRLVTENELDVRYGTKLLGELGEVKQAIEKL
jgi:hypothetical protein